MELDTFKLALRGTRRVIGSDSSNRLLPQLWAPRSAQSNRVLFSYARKAFSHTVDPSNTRNDDLTEVTRSTHIQMTGPYSTISSFLEVCICFLYRDADLCTRCYPPRYWEVSTVMDLRSGKYIYLSTISLCRTGLEFPTASKYIYSVFNLLLLLSLERYRWSSLNTISTLLLALSWRQVPWTSCSNWLRASRHFGVQAGSFTHGLPRPKELIDPIGSLSVPYRCRCGQHACRDWSCEGLKPIIL